MTRVSMHRFQARLAFVAFTLALASGWVAFAADSGKGAKDNPSGVLDEPKPSWKSGPVSVIITSEEEKEYKGLKEEEQRKSAIALFWTRRDPTPLSPDTNEYKDAFATWLEEANGGFNEASGSGWTSDRGRMLLLAGHPDKRDTSREAQETWNYNRPALAKLKDANATTVRVVFTKIPTGEFKTDGDGRAFLQVLQHADPVELVKAVMGSITDRPTKTVAAAMVKGSMPPADSPAPEAEETPGIQRLREATAAAERKSELTVVADGRTFLAQDGSTNLVFTIAVKRSEVAVGSDGNPSGLILYSRIAKPGDDTFKPVEFTVPVLYTLFDDQNEGWFKYGYSISLKPGDYELRAGVSDGPEGKMATVFSKQTLPDYGPGPLAMSVVTLASSAETAGADLKADNPFRFGTLELIPKATRELGLKEDLSWFYEVYNAKNNETTGKPTLEVSYNFEKKEATGWRKMIRTPLVKTDQHEQTLGYSIPNDAVVRWPPGDFRVTIQVKDTIANVMANTTLEFTIVK